MDVHNLETRRYNMSRIRNKDTSIELQVRSICHKLGLRGRPNQKLFNTRPDIVFKKYQTVIFVHGCFWHSHHCPKGLVKPKTNSEFWESKRNRTIERDQENLNILKNIGWNVITIWGCELENQSTLRDRLKKEFNLKD